MAGRGMTVLVGLVALSLAGCTGPDDRHAAPTAPPETSTAEVSPEEQITAVLTELGTSSGPDQCTDLCTPRALRQAIGSSDVQVCRDAVAGVVPADEVQVSDVVVDGSRATARAAMVGGDSGGLAQLVDLVRSGDSWMVDGYTAVEIVDRALVDARTAELVQAAGPGLMGPDDVQCVVVTTQAATDEELEGMYLEGTVHTVLVDAIRDCVGGGIDLTAILLLSSYQLEQAGLTRDQADCVAGLAIRDYGELTLEDIVTSPEAKETWMNGLREATAFGADDVGASGSVCSGA